MKKLLILGIVLLTACGPTRHITHKEIITTRVVDSIAWHDSTIYYEVPVERIKDVVPQYDSLHLETSLAEALAYVDTASHSLRGEIKNKENAEIKQTIKWKEKIVYKDSIKTKEVPVVVEVPVKIKTIPKTYWVFMGFSILSLLYFIITIYFKIK